MAKHALEKPKKTRRKPKRLEQPESRLLKEPAEKQEPPVRQENPRKPRYKEETSDMKEAPRKPRFKEKPQPLESRKPRFVEEPVRQESPREVAPRYREPVRQEPPKQRLHKGIKDTYDYEDNVRIERAPHPREAMSRSIKGAIILLSVLVIITIAALIAWDQFMVKDVVIYGLKTFNYADVVKLTGIGSNQNIFLTDLGEVEKSIERNPNIDVVDIRMILPSKIEITVSERIPTAIMQVLGQYLLLDESTYVLGVSDAPTGDYLKVSGMQVKSFEMGKVVSSDEVDKLESLQSVLAALKKRSCLHLVDSIDIEDENNIMMMAGTDILIKVGSAYNIEQKCAWIHDMVPSLQKSQQGEGTLHITDKNTAHFVPGSIDTGNEEEDN